jgi:hypothetical protein
MFVSLWPFVMIMNGDTVDAVDSGRDGWDADAMDGMQRNGLLRLCIFYVFWFVLHAGCELTTPAQPSALRVSKFLRFLRSLRSENWY